VVAEGPGDRFKDWRTVGGHRSLRRVTVEAAATAGAESVVVLRARSAARFSPDEGFSINVRAPGLGLEAAVQVRAFTRWVGEGNQAMPRELVVDVRGRAGSLDEAAGKFAALARPVATMAGFVANVRVGSLEVHLAYDSSPEKVEQELLEVFIPDEQGGVTEGRLIRLHLMEAACTALMGLTVDWSRVDRALGQYELALREWYLGGEWLAMSHLWIAAENLTKVLFARHVVRRRIGGGPGPFLQCCNGRPGAPALGRRTGSTDPATSDLRGRCSDVSVGEEGQ
jgi:hypothetical protein